jgi:tetratricopeptide (TPR) repeat protein
MSDERTARTLGYATLVAAAAFLLVTACGGSRRPSLAAQRLVADGLIAEGCYRCLDEAVVRYFGMPRGSAAAMRVNDTQLFRALVLLALREKELGLDPSQHLKQAGLLVPHTTAPAAAAEQLKWAGLVPSNPSGLPRDDADAERLRLAEARGDLERRLAGAATMSDPIDVYLNVALACSASFPVSGREPATLAAPAAAQSIVQWRLATCGRSHEDALRAFAETHPRYVEADYVLGRYRTAFIGDPTARREARDRLRAVDAAIPGSLAIAFDLAGVTRVTSVKDALPLYERITRRQPRHNEAWLGQGICLTYLERPREAIEALTRVIDNGRWVVGDARYWRAWNRHSLGALDEAWADIDEARKVLYNTDTYGLAGRIAYDRKELDTARPLLEKARELDDTNCGATWFLGLVHTGQERWIDGADVFERAETCYRGEIDRVRAELAGDRETDEAVRAERAAAADVRIRNAERQAALSAYNAAFAFVRGNQKARSRPLLDRAVQHPEVSDRARELRAFVDR